MEKRRRLHCLCLQDNVLLESMVIAITLVSGLAITGKNLLLFNLITVPKAEGISERSNNDTFVNSPYEPVHTNLDVLHILNQVFQYTSLAVAALFAVEILLKMATLQIHFLTKPWQVFDGLVVAGALGVEIAFYFLAFNEPGLYSVRYVVMLRLWRILFICSIRAKVVQHQLEEELDIYRRKTEEKISRMQDTITQQDERIRYLQTMAEKKIKKINSAKSKPAPKMTNPDDSDNGKNVKTSPAVKNPVLSKQDKQNSPFKETSFSRNAQEQKEGDLENNPDTNYEDRQSDNDDTVVMRMPRSEASYDLKGATERSKKMPVGQRKRCSSMSEYMEYGSMSSPERDIAYTNERDKSSSKTSVLDNMNSRDVDSESASEIKGSSSTLDLASETNSDVDSLSNKPYKTRQTRLTSCPEFVYTQRMNISSDDCKLISENSVINDPSIYDNMGFLSDDQIGLQILAEFDGVKTYCNENGIPMTSL